MPGLSEHVYKDLKINIINEGKSISEYVLMCQFSVMNYLCWSAR